MFLNNDDHHRAPKGQCKKKFKIKLWLLLQFLLNLSTSSVEEKSDRVVNKSSTISTDLNFWLHMIEMVEGWLVEKYGLGSFRAVSVKQWPSLPVQQWPPNSRCWNPDPNPKPHFWQRNKSGEYFVKQHGKIWVSVRLNCFSACLWTCWLSVSQSGHWG